MHDKLLCLLGLPFIVAGCSDSPADIADLEADGLVADGVEVQIQLDPLEITVVNDAGRPVLTTFGGETEGAYGGPGLVVDDPTYVAQVLPGWDGYTAHEGEWWHGSTATVVEFDATSASLEISDSERTLTLDIEVSPGEARFAVDGDPITGHTPGGEHTKLGLSFDLPEEERFFGLGERFATVQHRGWSIYSWAEELGISEGEGTMVSDENPYPNGPSMTGFPVPWLLSNQGYGMHLDTTYRTEVHLGSERENAWRVAVDTTELDFTVYVDDDPLALLEAFTADTGRAIIPPDWVFGPRRRTGRGSTVEGVPEYQMLRDRGVPTTGIDDSVHMLPHDSHDGIEDDLMAWTDTAHAMGYKVQCYNTPYVSQDDARSEDLYDYGVAHDLFVKTRSGYPATTWFISGHLQTLVTIDLTNPEGKDWFKELLQRSLDLGYDGWMHDFGEYVGRDWVFADGRRGDEMHNLFPVLSAQAAHELMTEQRPGDYLYFVRSGYTGTQQYTPAVWGSDPEVSFDETQGLPAQLMGGINLGMSGVPFWGSDVTGFKCLTEVERDKDNYLRWAQVGAVSPIMMEQNACSNPVSGGEEKWSLWDDQETWEVYGAAARLHTRLQPYFLALAEVAHETGAPLMRHPFLLFPGEPESWEVRDAFFLGPALYAAPVVERAAATRSVWLPPGDYVDLDDYAVYAGGATVEVPAPLSKLPLFLVAGEILPLWDESIETLAPATEPSVISVDDVDDRLDVIVALKPEQAAALTLADGTVLTASRGSDVGLPAGFTSVDEATLPDCASCFVVDSIGDVDRTRVNSASATAENVGFQSFTVSHADGPARRVRWELLALSH